MEQTVYLQLEDGTCLTGKHFGAPLKEDVIAEVVFTTAMTGYTETLTDPSYYGQMVVQTFPLIGNYGVNHEDNESFRPCYQTHGVEHSLIGPAIPRPHELAGKMKRIFAAISGELQGTPALFGMAHDAVMRRYRVFASEYVKCPDAYLPVHGPTHRLGPHEEARRGPGTADGNDNGVRDKIMLRRLFQQLKETTQGAKGTFLSG